MEIVTKPDFTNGEEASAFVREVQAALIRLNCCDGKMEGRLSPYVTFYIQTGVAASIPASLPS